MKKLNASPRVQSHSSLRKALLWFQRSHIDWSSTWLSLSTSGLLLWLTFSFSRFTLARLALFSCSFVAFLPIAFGRSGPWCSVVPGGAPLTLRLRKSVFLAFLVVVSIFLQIRVERSSWVLAICGCMVQAPAREAFPRAGVELVVEETAVDPL